MQSQQKNNFFLFFGNLLIFLSVSFLIVAVARAGFLTPNQNPPNNDIAEPLRIDGGGQIKDGGLVLNLQGIFDYGLSVYESPAGSGRGLVGIGTQSPSDRLHVVGNFKISERDGNSNLRGIIKQVDPVNPTSVGQLGNDGEVLTMTAPSVMEWADSVEKYAWMDIQRIDINNTGSCVSFFPQCPGAAPNQNPWTEYGIVTLKSVCDTTSFEYGNQVRICKREL
jgi:hypothetical protein